MEERWRFVIAGLGGLVVGAAVIFVVLGAKPTESPIGSPSISGDSEKGATKAPGDLSAGGAGSPKAPPGKAGEAAPANPDSEASRARESLRKAEEENARLQAEVKALQARIEEAGKPPFRPPQVFRFGLGEKTPTFDQADWPVLSGHMTSLAAILPKLADDIVNKEKLSDAVLKEVQANNMPLAVFAIQASKEMGGTGPNGAYTHPAVIANLIRAALQKAGIPLAEGQEIAIRALGTSWAAEEERRKKAYGESTPALTKIADEVDGKRRFLQAVKDILAPAQVGALFHPSLEGRIGLDLLSAGLVYTSQRPMTDFSRAELEKKILPLLFDLADLKPEDASGYEWIARQWLDEVPGCLVPLESARSMDLVFPHVNQVQEAARAEAAAIERIAGMGRLLPEQVKTLLDVNTVLVPRVVPGKAPEGEKKE